MVSTRTSFLVVHSFIPKSRTQTEGLPLKCVSEGLGKASGEHTLNTKVSQLKQALILNLHKGVSGDLLSPETLVCLLPRDVSHQCSLPDGLCGCQNTLFNDRSVF